jgi:SAM-dependent methyltransferase
MKRLGAGYWRKSLNRFMPYDVYERHSAVITLLQDFPIQNVLDVGGRTGLLKRFTPWNVVALNIDGTGDVQYDGRAVPFADRQFSAVVSVDTLEHLPIEKRQGFLKECLRVAKQCLIIAAPYGSPGHIASEERLGARYRQVHNRGHTYLEEHIRYGLPTESELKELVAGLGQGPKHRLLYAGDYVWQAKQFQVAWLDQGQHTLWWRFRRLRDHLSSLACFRSARLSEQPYASANRFYLVLYKT